MRPVNGALLLIVSIVILILGYALYGRWLAKKWGIDPSRETPAHTEYDGVAAAQLVISALLFVLAVFLMVEGLRTLNAQRRARLSESA